MVLRIVFSLFLLNVVMGTSVRASEYCMAIRGNGESMPAHWGGIASVVEKLGLPKIQSGGSSASITMFFLESVAANPWVNEVSGEEQASRAAFLVKSLHGIFIYLQKYPEIHATLDINGAMQNISKILQDKSFGEMAETVDFLKTADVTAIRNNTKAITKLLETLNSLGIGETDHYKILLTLLQKAVDQNASQKVLLSSDEVKYIGFYSQDLKTAITQFGKFNAESDKDLFFREGIINFQKLGFSFGKTATFLAGVGWNSAVNKSFSDLTQSCFENHIGITWQEIMTKNPRCQNLLEDVLKNYYAQNLFKSGSTLNVVLKVVGGISQSAGAVGRAKASIISLPTTSVLIESAYDEAKKSLDLYHVQMNREAAEKFQISENSKVKFGYWGPPALLSNIEAKIKSSDLKRDEKSSRFLALGQPSWSTVLALSPAEPGLASLQEMVLEDNKTPAFSVGGWSDLQPVLVLKAAGCQNVVYISRSGADSPFAQGVAKRLLTSSDLVARLFDVTDPQSSFMLSVANASAVLCSDWDHYNVKTQLTELISNAYKAPFYIPMESQLAADLSQHGIKSTAENIGCRPPKK